MTGFVRLTNSLPPTKKKIKPLSKTRSNQGLFHAEHFRPKSCLVFKLSYNFWSGPLIPVCIVCNDQSTTQNGPNRVIKTGLLSEIVSKEVARSQRLLYLLIKLLNDEQNPWNINNDMRIASFIECGDIHFWTKRPVLSR